MEIIYGIEKASLIFNRPLYLALGNFDGVHRGHQAIISAAVKKAEMSKGLSAVLLFSPHPATALRPEKPLALLTDIADRAEIMKELGLDYLIIEPFTLELASLTPEDFVSRYLVKSLNVKAVFIGENYKFGNKGSGNSELLIHLGRINNFEVFVSELHSYVGQEISSSRIRTLLRSGAVKDASNLLGYYFFRQGKVIRGYGIGRKLVYPTANIDAGPYLLWPGKGVYLTVVGKLEKSQLFGVTNVGPCPTFNHFDAVVETHILNFQGLIYNHEIRISFLEKLRDTMTFSSPSELKNQIDDDIQKAICMANVFMRDKKGKRFSLQAICSMLRSQ